MHVARSRDKGRAVVYTIMDRGKFPDKSKKGHASCSEGHSWRGKHGCELRWY